MAVELSDYKRVLLFGGSFDPPHRAHIELPQQAARAIGADMIAYIPACRAPHKLDQQQTAPAHRLAMLRLALDSQPQPIPCTVLTIEADRGPEVPSYTVDTLDTIQKQLKPGTELRLLIGADQLRIFDQWREPDRVAALATPLVMVRPPDTPETLLDSLPPQQRKVWRERLVEVDSLDISSTQIRESVSAGLPIDMWVAPAVANYIEEHNLYR